MYSSGDRALRGRCVCSGLQHSLAVATGGCGKGVGRSG